MITSYFISINSTNMKCAKNIKDSEEPPTKSTILNQCGTNNNYIICRVCKKSKKIKDFIQVILRENNYIDSDEFGYQHLYKKTKTCNICRTNIMNNYNKRMAKKNKQFKLIINSGSIGSIFDLPLNTIDPTKEKMSKFWTLQRKNNQCDQYSRILTNRWNILSKMIERDIIREKRQNELNQKIHDNYINYLNRTNSVTYGISQYNKYN